MNFYSEFDPKAAATLRELIQQGHIAPGVVDERSIEDVLPEELLAYTQVHLFAGFGLWSLAFRWAGISDDEPAWSCSCPCQPFSAAGKGKKFSDERHLWPAAFHLVQHAKRPEVPIYGEQVAGARVMPWIDLVWSDLEATGHTFRPFILASAGFGAPIIRQRTFWVARAESPNGRTKPEIDGNTHWRNGSGRSGDISRLARSYDAERRSNVAGGNILAGSTAGRLEGDGESGTGGDAIGLEYSSRAGRIERRTESGEQSTSSGCGDCRLGEPNLQRPQGRSGVPECASECVAGQSGVAGGLAVSNGGEPSDGDLQRSWQQRFEPEDGSTGDSDRRTGPTNGFWAHADWLRCRDDKWRPVEPGTFPLAHGYPERVGLLRGFGNAISPQVAAEFIKADLEAQERGSQC